MTDLLLESLASDANWVRQHGVNPSAAHALAIAVHIEQAIAQIQQMRSERANRYWEGRYRDEAADNDHMRKALRHLLRAILDYHESGRRPTKDELFAMMSWAMSGIGETAENEGPAENGK